MEQSYPAVSLSQECAIRPVCISRPRCCHRKPNDGKLCGKETFGLSLDFESQASPQEEDSDDDVSVNEPTPLTPIQATDAVKAIRDFVITLEDSAMEDAFERLQIKTKRQSNLNEYFQ